MQIKKIMKLRSVAENYTVWGQIKKNMNSSEYIRITSCKNYNLYK